MLIVLIRKIFNMIKKYGIPLLVSLFFFMVMGFFPSDCISDNGEPSCSIMEEELIDFETCTYQGFPLHGKIQFVESFPDIKVKIVEHFPDLKVKMVTHFPDDCGEWQVVTSFPDVKVQLVEHFPDIKIKLVEHFPGKP